MTAPLSYVGALTLSAAALKSLLSSIDRAITAMRHNTHDADPLVRLALEPLHLQRAVAEQAIQQAECALSIRRVVEDWPDLPLPQLSLPRYVAIVGGGSISAGAYYSEHGVRRYGVECRRMQPTPNEWHALIVSLAADLEAAHAAHALAIDNAEPGDNIGALEDRIAVAGERLFAAVRAHNAVRDLPATQAVDARVPQETAP